MYIVTKEIQSIINEDNDAVIARLQLVEVPTRDIYMSTERQNMVNIATTENGKQATVSTLGLIITAASTTMQHSFTTKLDDRLCYKSPPLSLQHNYACCARVAIVCNNTEL